MGENKGSKYKTQRDYYEYLLTQFTEIVKFDLSNLGGHMLLLAGTDDKFGPSEKFAREIYETYKDKAELQIFEGADHAFYPYISSDGKPYISNIIASIKSKYYMLNFLKKYHN